MKDIVSEAQAILERFPAEIPPLSGDLTPLGSLHQVLSDALAFATARNAPPEILRSLQDLPTLAEKILLGESQEPETTLRFLFDTGRRLCEALVAWEKGEKVPPLAEIENPSPPAQEEEKKEKPDKPQEDSSGHDLIHLASKEDATLYHEFVSESSEHLETIESRVLELENNPENRALVDEMFRCFHSMKGAAGFLGLPKINHLTHQVETFLDRVRKKTLRFDREAADILLAAIDVSKRMVAAIEMQIEAGIRGAPPPSLPPTDSNAVIKAIETLLTREPVLPLPPLPSGTPGNRLGDLLVAKGVVHPSQVEEALRIQQRPLGQILVEMGAATPSDVQEALIQQTTHGKKPESAIKVETNRIDRLMEMVGELVIAESQVAEDFRKLHITDPRIIRRFADLRKIAKNLQELTMTIRMVPLRQTFQRMIRLVRDTAKKTNKDVELILFGEETEIDKTLIDAVADPLIHLLRNAVDHGIELPEVRRAAGKDPKGKVWLGAYHESGNVVIEVRDDGAGLKRDRILAKGIERGLLDPNVPHSDEEIYNLIFLPGFSTHDVATAISGRGVGMDVVKKNIEMLNGRIDLSSIPGKGTTFWIRLPLTMAIMDGMIVRVGTERYILPTLGIVESFQPGEDQLTTVVRQGELVLLRGQLLPLLRLHALFGIEKAETRPTHAILIVVEANGERVAFLVDEILTQQQVVIKNLGTRFAGLRGISGGSILGDGRVGLILDIGTLVEWAREKGSLPPANREMEETVEENSKRSISA